MMYFFSPNLILSCCFFFVSVFRVRSGPCDHCAVTEKQIKKTDTEFEDTNQKNLSVISELGEHFCFVIIMCGIVSQLRGNVYTSVTINPSAVMCVGELRGREEDSEG